MKVRLVKGVPMPDKETLERAQEDKAEGKFRARLNGSPSFNPRDKWSFTVYYHLVKE